MNVRRSGERPAGGALRDGVNGLVRGRWFALAMLWIHAVSIGVRRYSSI